MINYKNPLIYIVEDDPAFQKLCEKILKLNKLSNIKTFDSGKQCLDNIHKQKPDIVLQDYDLPEGLNGLETMIEIKKIYPDSEFIFLSGQTSIKVAVETLKQGAFDYVVKDDGASETLIQRIKKLLKIVKLEDEKQTLRMGKRAFAILLVLSWVVIILLKLFELV